MSELTSFQRSILKAVGRCTSGGFVVGDIAFLVGRQPGYESNRAHSALISRECAALEKSGLLRRLDEYKPIAWCATDAAKGMKP